MSFTNANNNANTFANNDQIDHANDQSDEECDTDVPMYEGELCNEWRYSCALCFTASGFTPTSRQSLPNFLVHLIEAHAEGEALDLIARVTLAQYPPLRCGPARAGRGSSSSASSVRGGSVQGSVRSGSVQGSVRSGSIQSSMQRSTQGATRGGYRGSAAPATRSSRSTQPAPVATAPALSTAEIYQQMLAQNRQMLAHMQANGLGNMASLSSAVNSMEN